MRNLVHTLCLLCLSLLVTLPARAAEVVRFDFTDPRTVRAWAPDHDIAALLATPEGMEIAIIGEDPYLHGPARDYPAGQPLWLTVRLKADRSGTLQVFWFPDGGAATEGDSVRAAVPAGSWQTVRLPLPPLGPSIRLRLDPPGDGGMARIASLSIAPRTYLAAPAWPRPTPPRLPAGAPLVRSGDLLLRHSPDRLGAFIVTVAGREMATGHDRPLIGYQQAGTLRWLDLAKAARVTVTQDAGGLTVRAVARDAEGGTWTIRQRFAPARPGALSVETRAACDRDRDVVYLPMLTLLPGAGSFGAGKDQALFAGLEYLGRDEPSSSEKDIIGPGRNRQVPDTEKITLPLMAVQAGGRYIGLAWDRSAEFAAAFDSPDRAFGSGGHLMALLFPGSDGVNRDEASLLPYGPERLPAGRPLVLRAHILGGRGESVVPAVRQYVALHPLPPVPPTGLDWEGFAHLAAAGWLDSGIAAGGRFRHAYPGFGAQPAVDAAYWMDYLAGSTEDTTLSGRLKDAAAAALSAAGPDDRLSSVGHVTTFAPALLYGPVAGNVAATARAAREQAARFEPDGRLIYRPAPGGVDYARTQPSREANGFAARPVVSILEAAALTGDAGLRRAGLRLLHALDRFAGTVPRGAQTWEVPLHTPDILASAHLVRAYTLGYELTGDVRLLRTARDWAWTGVPFLYLSRPVDGAAGPYASIAVFGSSGWQNQNWMGLPVQWCGMVYADALRRLAPYDPGGPWVRIADGITASGIQQTHPLGLDPMRQGLLPDSFALRTQIRRDPAINPATLLSGATGLYGRPAPYAYHVFRGHGVTLHAPGPLAGVSETGSALAFSVRSAVPGEYRVLLSGLAQEPRVRIDGREAPLAPPHEYVSGEGLLVLRLSGPARVEVFLGE